MTEILSYILYQYLLYNVNIQVDKSFMVFQKKNMFHNFNDNCFIKKWHEFKHEHTVYMKILFSVGATNRLSYRKMEKLFKKTMKMELISSNSWPSFNQRLKIYNFR